MDVQKIGDGRIVVNGDTYVNENRPRVLTPDEHDRTTKLEAFAKSYMENWEIGGDDFDKMYHEARKLIKK